MLIILKILLEKFNVLNFFYDVIKFAQTWRIFENLYTFHLKNCVHGK